MRPATIFTAAHDAYAADTGQPWRWPAGLMPTAGEPTRLTRPCRPRSARSAVFLRQVVEPVLPPRPRPHAAGIPPIKEAS